jgi:hypothetical protein
MEGMESHRFTKLVYPRFGRGDGERGKRIKSCRYQTGYRKSLLVSVKTTRYAPLVVVVVVVVLMSMRRMRKFIM